MTAEQFATTYGIKLPEAFLRASEAFAEDTRGHWLPVEKGYSAYCTERDYLDEIKVPIQAILCLESPYSGKRVAETLEMLREYRELDPHYLPIAECGNGDVILLDTHENCSSMKRILHWDHESGEVAPVSDTLENFYKNLQLEVW